VNEGVREGKDDVEMRERTTPWKSPFTPDSFTMCLHVWKMLMDGRPLAAAA
jgi:hypothetical protein